MCTPHKPLGDIYLLARLKLLILRAYAAAAAEVEDIGNGIALASPRRNIPSRAFFGASFPGSFKGTIPSLGTYRAACSAGDLAVFTPGGNRTGVCDAASGGYEEATRPSSGAFIGRTLVGDLVVMAPYARPSDLGVFDTGRYPHAAQTACMALQHQVTPMDPGHWAPVPCLIWDTSSQEPAPAIWSGLPCWPSMPSGSSSMRDSTSGASITFEPGLRTAPY